MQKKLNITIIADNGGGITLQIAHGNKKYQHTYWQIYQVAEDILAAENGANISDWEGNESDDWLVPTSDEINNGGYKITSPEELRLANKEESYITDQFRSWANLSSLMDELDYVSNNRNSSPMYD